MWNVLGKTRELTINGGSAIGLAAGAAILKKGRKKHLQKPYRYNANRYNANRYNNRTRH